MKNLYLLLLNDEEGQGMTEYVLIICLVVMVCFGVFSLFGMHLQAIICRCAENIMLAAQHWNN